MQLGDGASFLLRRIEPGVEDLQENPLCPAVKLNIGGGHGASFIVCQAQATELTFHVVNGFLGFHPWVCSRLNGVLLGRQAKRVIAQGMQHVFAQHSVVSSEHVSGNVSQRVPHMQARPRGEGEHVLHKQLFLRQCFAARGGKVAYRVWGVKSAVVYPEFLPRFLYRGSQFWGITMCRGLARISHEKQSRPCPKPAAYRRRVTPSPRYCPGLLPRSLKNNENAVNPTGPYASFDVCGGHGLVQPAVFRFIVKNLLQLFAGHFAAQQPFTNFHYFVLHTFNIAMKSAGLPLTQAATGACGAATPHH